MAVAGAGHLVVATMEDVLVSISVPPTNVIERVLPKRLFDHKAGGIGDGERRTRI